MVDDFSSGQGILGSLESVIARFPPDDFMFAVAIGYSNLEARWGAFRRVREAGYTTPVLVHPKAYVASTATISAGVMVMAGAIVDTNARVGEASVLWPGACVNHDVTIGRNTFVSPNAVICGCASVGDSVFIGAGAAVVDYGDVPTGSRLKMLTTFTERKA